MFEPLFLIKRTLNKCIHSERRWATSETAARWEETKTFDIVQGFRRGITLSCYLFSFVIKSVLRKAEIHYKARHLVKLSSCLCTLTVLAALNVPSRKQLLAAFTRYVWSTSKNMRHIRDGYKFAVVNELTSY